MIEAIAEKMALSIKRANEKETVSVAVMKFALIIMINIIIPVVLSLLVGLLTNKLLETAFALGTIIVIRMLSGGYHFKSPIICMTAMIIGATLPPHITLPEYWILGLTIISIILFLMLAPSNLRGYHTMPEKYYPMLKVASVLLVSSNLFFDSHILALVFTLQGISLFQWKEV